MTKTLYHHNSSTGLLIIYSSFTDDILYSGTREEWKDIKLVHKVSDAIRKAEALSREAALKYVANHMRTFANKMELEGM